MSRNLMQQFEEARSIDWGRPEAIEDELYDNLAYVAAGQVKLSFFAVPLNAGATLFGGGSTKTFEDTNLAIASAMPRGEAFLAQYIYLDFIPGIQPVQETLGVVGGGVAQKYAANDADVFWRQGWLDFQIAGKSVLTGGPLKRFPSPVRMQLDFQTQSQFGQAAAAAVDYEVNGSNLQPRGKLYMIEGPGALLEHGVTFGLTLNWTVALALPSMVAGRARASFMGKRMRVAS